MPYHALHSTDTQLFGTTRAHVSLTLLATLCLAASTPTTVTLDLSTLDDATYRRIDGLSLEKKLVLRLLEDGFGVVPASASADRRATFLAQNGRLTIRVGPLSREVELDGPTTQLHLEIAQKLSALLREPEPKVEVPAVVAAPVVVPKSIEPAPSPFRPHVFVLPAVLIGRDVPRPSIRLGAGASWHWLLATLQGSFTRAAANELTFDEGQLGAALQVQLRPLDRVIVRGGVGGGLWLHGWRSTRIDDAAPLGLRVLPSWWVPVSVSVALWEHLNVGAGATLLGHAPIDHRSNADVLWNAGVVRLEAGVFLAIE